VDEHKVACPLHLHKIRVNYELLLRVSGKYDEAVSFRNTERQAHSIVHCGRGEALAHTLQFPVVFDLDAHLLLSKVPFQENHARSQILDFGHRAVQIDFLVKNP
jgi:hypothetical protein